MPDKEILEFYKETHDIKYVAELFNRYAELISAICLSYFKNIPRSEDAVMSIFEVLVEDLKKHEVLNFKSWLFSVTRNYCLKQLRKERREQAQNDEIKELETEVVEFNPIVDQENKRLEQLEAEKITTALNKLPEEQRTCVKLFYLQELRYKEICAETGFTEKQVKSYIQNGKRNLRNYLSE